MSRKKGRPLEFFNTRLPADIIQRLKIHGLQHNMSASETIEKLIREHLPDYRIEEHASNSTERTS